MLPSLPGKAVSDRRTLTLVIRSHRDPDANSVIRPDPEWPREERLTSEDAERKLFAAANPHLRGVLTAMFETCCRPGEILSLQWQDVDMAVREITIRAEKAKTRRARGRRKNNITELVRSRSSISGCS